jgi:hypothetical protein
LGWGVEPPGLADASDGSEAEMRAAFLPMNDGLLSGLRYIGRGNWHSIGLLGAGQPWDEKLCAKANQAQAKVSPIH